LLILCTFAGMHVIAGLLISWYQEHKRDLPWRQTTDPYRIWLSEVILQQTRVEQGLSYYLRFLERFPDVHSLAMASEEEVLKLWQGLGYYSRARNLHAAAISVVKEYGGSFPASYPGLKKLKGVGDYTAAAIASIAFGEVVPVVDGNVARVLSRLFMINEEVNTTKGYSELRTIAESLIPRREPAIFNQAVMEFGALHCRPLNPLCENCPLDAHCMSFRNNRVDEYPKKQKPVKAREVFYYYLVFDFSYREERCLLIRKRSEEGIWKNMYDFPLIETEKKAAISEILEHELMKQLVASATIRDVNISAEFRHQLSHRSITAVFIRLLLDAAPDVVPGTFIIRRDEIGRYPVPRLIERYLEG